MAKEVQRVKLSWWERLYIPTFLNGFKVTLSHFFSFKKSKVYEEKNKDNKFKATLNYPEELWTVPEGFRGAPYLVSDQNDNTKCVSCQLCEFVCPRPSESRLQAKTARTPIAKVPSCLLYTSPSPRDATLSRMPSSA